MALSYTTISAPAVTALNSLADAAYWVSPDFDNATNLALELDVFITLLTTTTAGATGGIDVYVAGSNDGGTNYTGGITTQSDATYSPTGDDVSEWDFLDSFTYTTETTARTLEKLMRMFSLPKNFKLVVFNDTGTALGATTCAVEYQAVKF